MTNETKITINNYSLYKKHYPLRHRKGLAPQTMALAFCMYATGIYKITTRDEMHEFILRIALIFRYMSIFENFFTDDFLIRFNYKGRVISLVPDDFKNHTGMQFINFNNEMPSRDEWMQKLWSERRNLNQIAALLSFVTLNILPEITINDDAQGYAWLNINPGESDNEIHNAGILADIITKNIDEKQFVQCQDLNSEKLTADKKQNVKTLNQSPFIFDCWRRSDNSKIVDDVNTSTTAGSSDLLSDTNKAQEQKDVYIPWPFIKGKARHRECYRIDPSLN